MIRACNNWLSLLCVMVVLWMPKCASLASISSTHLPRVGRSGVTPPNMVPFLSVLIPAYNEEDRLGLTLQSYHDYLVSHSYWRGRSQIVVCNDGSTDGTQSLVEERWVEKNANTTIPVSCVSLALNSGKGAALACGMQQILETRPQSWILTADADGSAPLDGGNLDAVLERLQQWYADHRHTKSADDSRDGQGSNDQLPIVVCGYRTYASAAPSRLLFRWGFRSIVRAVVGDLGVRDSQCGFKLLSPTATALYDDLNLSSWSHDVEVLYRARALGVTVLEQAVAWTDQPGSKLMASPGGILAVCTQMFWQVALLKCQYASGRWTLPRARVKSP